MIPFSLLKINFINKSSIINFSFQPFHDRYCEHNDSFLDSADMNSTRYRKSFKNHPTQFTKQAKKIQPLKWGWLTAFSANDMWQIGDSIKQLVFKSQFTSEEETSRNSQKMRLSRI